MTVLADAIRIHGTKLGKSFVDQGVPYKTLPALKIGRLCVDDKFRDKGIGTKTTLFAMSFLLKINEKAGCRFLISDAKKDAIHFYKKNGV